MDISNLRSYLSREYFFDVTDTCENISGRYFHTYIELMENQSTTDNCTIELYIECDDISNDSVHAIVHIPKKGSTTNI
jgi:hypothetical protein